MRFISEGVGLGSPGRKSGPVPESTSWLTLLMEATPDQRPGYEADLLEIAVTGTRTRRPGAVGQFQHGCRRTGKIAPLDRKRHN